MINGFIKGQSLKIVAPLIVSDSIRYLEAKFYFQTSDWNGRLKWAHFSKGDTVYDISLNDDDAITKSENLNLSAGVWEIYLHGTGSDGSRITTEKETIEVKRSGILDGEPFQDVPLTALEQLEQRVNDISASRGCQIYFGAGEMPEGYREQVVATEEKLVNIPSIKQEDKDELLLEVKRTVEEDVQDIFDSEKDRMVQDVIEAVVGDVSGAVDENNIVTLDGDIPAGTYTFKLRMSDGSTVTIGTAVKS